jgi:Arc/MetJ-type ribon-helix-helix transcriptional regulator
MYNDTTWCYAGVMGQRTQVYLSDSELDLLDRARRTTGASRSELIRRAVQKTYGDAMSTEERVRVLRETAGAWKDRGLTGAEYVDAIRGDLSERLTRLGVR